MEKNITFKFTEKNFANPNQMQALTLAYIGDSIYDIMSREYVMKNHLGKIQSLNASVAAGIIMYERIKTKKQRTKTSSSNC